MGKSAATNALSIAAPNEAADNIEVHGGMGFTWEAAPHLYFKRAKSSELLFGDAAHHREELAKHVGL